MIEKLALWANFTIFRYYLIKLVIMAKQINVAKSIDRVVNYLIKNPFKTEGEITKAVFRADSQSRKYANVFKRALDDGLIGRQNLRVEGIQSRFFYYVPRS